MDTRFIFHRRRDHAFRGQATFSQIANFSHTYMRLHSDNAAIPHPDGAHIFLLAAQGHCIKMSLIDKDGRVVEAPCGHETRIWCPNWGDWLGYPQSVTHGFKWTSCSGSVLTAQKLDTLSPWGEAQYELECWPSSGEEGCGYMDTLRRIGVRFTEIMPQWITPSPQAEPLPQPQGSSEDRDVEPEWCPIERTVRPQSLC
jgi:hypothetical protein